MDDGWRMGLDSMVGPSTVPKRSYSPGILDICAFVLGALSLESLRKNRRSVENKEGYSVYVQYVGGI